MKSLEETRKRTRILSSLASIKGTAEGLSDIKDMDDYNKEALSDGIEEIIRLSTKCIEEML